MSVEDGISHCLHQDSIIAGREYDNNKSPGVQQDIFYEEQNVQNSPNTYNI